MAERIAAIRAKKAQERAAARANAERRAATPAPPGARPGAATGVSRAALLARTRRGAPPPFRFLPPRTGVAPAKPALERRFFHTLEAGVRTVVTPTRSQ